MPSETIEERQPRFASLRRLPLWGIAITLLVLLGAIASTPAVRDAATGEPVQEAFLAFSPGYLALSPVFDVLDALTLLSERDHVALLIWLIGIYTAWRALRRRKTLGPAVGRSRREAGLATLLVIVVLL